MPDEYESLLMRARAKVPAIAGTGERFQMPPADILQEGKITVVRNFAELLEKMNRTADQVVPLLLREIGIAGNFEPGAGRLVLQGRVPDRSIEERLAKYVETYVICGECGRPDTHLVREERTLVVKCDACGGHRPVRATKKAQTQQKAEAVEEGKQYEVMIEDEGKRGDGIARREKFVIFVNGAKKGQVVKVRITKVTGTLAFAEMVREQGPPSNRPS
ncbi:MAG TPA: translation initiation factor IF-2 subunit beta [Candidatus Thermoplasmatota archaeon]|nr:translation initiation factor IF-2 subunit beta [Candidatus Thermoplasmatota archaeon]